MRIRQERRPLEFQPPPRLRRWDRSAWTPGLSLVLALGLIVGERLSAQLSRVAIFRGFKVPEFYDTPLTEKGQTNRLKGMLQGAVARYVTNDVWQLNEMRLDHIQLDGQTNLVARAPECLANTDTHLAWSTGRLEIVGLHGALFVEGNEGFEARMSNSTLIISNRVRCVFRRDPLNPSKP